MKKTLVSLLLIISLAAPLNAASSTVKSAGRIALHVSKIILGGATLYSHVFINPTDEHNENQKDIPLKISIGNEEPKTLAFNSFASGSGAYLFINGCRGLYRETQKLKNTIQKTESSESENAPINETPPEPKTEEERDDDSI